MGARRARLPAMRPHELWALAACGTAAGCLGPLPVEGEGAGVLDVPLGAALVLGDGTADPYGNVAGCGATRVGEALLVTARHCADGSARYVRVQAGTSRHGMREVAVGATWIAAGRAPARADLYGNDLAFLVTDAPLPDDVPTGTVETARATGPVTTNVLAWAEQLEPTHPTYSLTAYERSLSPGPFGVADAVRDGELYLEETLVLSGDSGTALVDPSGAVRGVVSRGLRASEVPGAPTDRYYVGAVWATVGAFCERIGGAPESLIVSPVVDWRLEDGDPVWPTSPAEQAAVDEVRALCAP